MRDWPSTGWGKKPALPGWETEREYSKHKKTIYLTGIELKVYKSDGNIMLMYHIFEKHEKEVPIFRTKYLCFTRAYLSKHYPAVTYIRMR